MNNLEALEAINGDAGIEEYISAYQHLINTGDAWRLEGSIGRQAMALIEDGLCALGLVGHFDYYGNYVPSRYEVEVGTKGSEDYVRDTGNQVMPGV